MESDFVSFDDIFHPDEGPSRKESDSIDSDNADDIAKDESSQDVDQTSPADSDDEYEEPCSDFVLVEDIIRHYAKRSQPSDQPYDSNCATTDPSASSPQGQKAEINKDNSEVHSKPSSALCALMESTNNLMPFQNYLPPNFLPKTPDTSYKSAKELVRSSREGHDSKCAPVTASRSKSLDSKRSPDDSTDLSGLQDLAAQNWFWGPIRYEDAEKVLAGRPDGSFLVRDSSGACDLLTVSLRSGGLTVHIRIIHSHGRFQLCSGDMGHESVVGLIEDAMEVSQRRVYRYTAFGGRRAVRLLTPVSRHSKQVPFVPFRARSGVVKTRAQDEDIWANPWA